MPIVGGLDIHRKQITFDYLDTETGQVRRGQVSPADREHLRAWLARFNGREDVAFAVEGCTGWRYVAEELAAAGVAAHLAEPADTAFARGRKRHAKTDKTDCRHLRMLLAEGRLPECWIPPGHILECRALHLRPVGERRRGTARATISSRRGADRVGLLQPPQALGLGLGGELGGVGGGQIGQPGVHHIHRLADAGEGRGCGSGVHLGCLLPDTHGLVRAYL